MMVLHKITVELETGPWVVFVNGPHFMSREYLLNRLHRKFPDLSMEIWDKINAGQYADDRVEVID